MTETAEGLPRPGTASVVAGCLFVWHRRIISLALIPDITHVARNSRPTPNALKEASSYLEVYLAN